MERKTKIVCTMGPATNNMDTLVELLEAGMNVARMNFSHGTHEAHEEMYNNLRQAALLAKKPLGILGDLQGPKIRLGEFKEGKTVWNKGETVVITTDDIIGDHDRVSTTYKNLTSDAKPGDRILVDDGLLSLTVTGVTANEVTCLVVEGGPVSNHKGMNLPGMSVSVPALTEKDLKDLEFALRLGVDFIALSFVRHPSDVDIVHKIMDKVGKRVPVIAKLEKPEVVENFEDIVLAFDAIMVARGDLGVELPLQDVPIIQKRAIQLARENAKPVIVATQMLDSMIRNSRPTRAEVSDVANAVFDGTDAVMLSGETAMGAYPVDAVRTMSDVVIAAEASGIGVPALDHIPRTQRGVMSLAAKDIAERLDAKAIVAFTQSGDTLKRIARLHPELKLLAFTPNESVKNQLALSWGTEGYSSPVIEDTDGMLEFLDKALDGTSGLKLGDEVVIIAGSPPGKVGSTNFVRVHKIGDWVD